VRQTRETAWNNHVKTLVAGLGEMLETIRAAGWIADAGLKGLALVVTIGRGDMRASTGSGRPFLRYEMDTQGAVTAYQARPSLGSSDPTTLQPDDVNLEAVEARVLKFFRLWR
jgi:hypothetical protein